MNKPTHPFFRWPGSVLWLLPLIASALLFWRTESIESVWWYLVVPPLVALVCIDLFSTVWFGITTLILLFLYCSIGSSGAPVSFVIWEPAAWVNLREMRAFEMTEFEWFHWWPFKWLVAILCLNMATVTVRKIKFNILTVGVWTIHSGVIVMVLGCVVYFSLKIEGDVLVSRRVVEIKVPGEEPISMVATLSNSVSIGDSSYTITDINPSWTLMSGEDKGEEVYTVTVQVQRPNESFMRQLIAGYPEYTEDIVQSGDPTQPMARAKNVVGTALFDEALEMSLLYDTKDTFYVTQSGALYLRELHTDGRPKTKWLERPIENLPRFNDYIAGYDDVWTFGKPIQLSPLAIPVHPTTDNDPIDQDIIVDSYLRYAYMDKKTVGGGKELFPATWVTLRKGSEAEQSVEMYAFDPSANSADPNLMTYKWIKNNTELAQLTQTLLPTITATINNETYVVPFINSDDLQQIGDTEYFYKIDSVQNDLNIGGMVVSLVVVEIKHGDRTWQRWVFDDSSMNRDVIEGSKHKDDQTAAATFIDTNITMSYSPGAAPITIVGGLDNGSYVMLTTIGGNDPESKQLPIGKAVALTEEVTITLDRAEQFTHSDTRPRIIPLLQREPSASNMYSMIRVVIPSSLGSVSTWLPFHQYPVESPNELVRRFQYKPTTVRLPSGKLIEMMYSRQSAPLPVPIALERFEIDSHLGGFTGSTSSILNWRSIVTFQDGNETELAVSVNDPKSYGEFWFFQSQWDPPDGASPGLNYTVLGVGNRHGVFVMLFGCCLTVAGMLWAFYVKPMIKRKRQQAIYAEVSK
jgi:hypothetical protein